MGGYQSALNGLRHDIISGVIDQRTSMPAKFNRSVNPPLAGRGANIAPLANFLNNFEARADIDAKLMLPYSASI